MSLVDIRIDLPSHSHSFTISVPSRSSVHQVKQEIYRTCPGQPRPDGQRLICRGRQLSDNESIELLWKSDPRIVHLAVHPSAWSSSPPEVSATQPSSRASRSKRGGSVAPDHILTYVTLQHQKALSSLSSAIPPPNELENAELCRLVAKNELEQNGWKWPDILDVEFPPPSEGGLSYDSTTLDGQSYLRLLDPAGSPTIRQMHALRVLTYTFTILNMTLRSPSPIRNAPAQQSITIPPHVNHFLQQMGLPPLRVVNDHVVQPVPNQDNPAPPEIREINIRPLLAPLMMLLLRTVLLFYFVAPARKPIFGILIFAWMLYEILQPIRNGLRNGWAAAQDQQRQDEPRQPQNNNVAQRNVAWQPAANVPARPNIMAGTLDQQFDAFLDGLANINIADEERTLNLPPERPNSEPGPGRKIMVFIGLLVSTLHPAIWNRRRVALRRREGTIRTEANARNAPPPAEDERAGQVRDELRRQFSGRPRWIQRYMERVLNEDWVDDSD